MKIAHALAGALVAALAASTAASAQTTLNVATAGDQNMVDYINDYLGPLFEKQNPGVKVRAVGTGAGDAGSQKIFERLDAQAKSGAEKWDVDVAVVHQKISGKLVALPGRYRHRQARDQRQRQGGSWRAGRRLCHADVQQPDGHRLQPGPREEPALDL
jgi:hypothetical protein